MKQLLFGYGLILSALIGALLAGFYWLQNALIELFWPTIGARPVINLLIVLVIGAIILVTQRLWGTLPQNIIKIRVQLKTTGSVDYRRVLLQLIVPAIILVSGTSLGPEATLVSSTVLYGVWMAEKLNYVAHHFQSADTRARLQMLVVPHRYLQSLSVADWKNQFPSKLIRNALIGIFFTNMLIWFAIGFHISGLHSLVMHIGVSHWQSNELWLFGPILAVSYGLGTVIEWLLVHLKWLIANRFTNPLILVTVGGAAIYLCGLLVPEVLFSGQHNFHLFATNWPNQAGITLLGVAILKLILTAISQSTGWLGGDIFPVLFAATNFGFAISYLLPNVDRIFVVTLFVMGMATAILKSPLLVGSLMGILYVPTNLIGIVVLATLLMMLLKRTNKILAWIGKLQFSFPWSKWNAIKSKD